jgi:uncharacterized membrane protein
MDKKVIFGITSLFPLCLCVLAFMIREDNNDPSTPVLTVSEQKDRLKSALTQRVIPHTIADCDH